MGLAFDSTNRKLVLRAQSADAPANGKGTISFETGATPSEIARFAPSTGNLLLKSDGIDSSNGKLQLATHTTSAGGIGFGTDTSLYRAAAGILAIDGTSTAFAKLRLLETGSLKFQLESVAGDVTLATLTAGKTIKFNTGNDTLALTLDSSQNATFAGTAIFGKAGSNTTFSANGTTAESGIYTQLNTGFVFFADNASATKGIKVDVNNGGLTVLSGGLTTATAGGSAGTWKLGVYSATAPSATGYVTIDIGGTTYKLLAST